MTTHLKVVSIKDYEYGHFKKGDVFEFRTSHDGYEIDYKNGSWSFSTGSFHEYFDIIEIIRGKND